MIEIEREEDRVALPRAFLRDPRLSLRARGLLASLLAGGEREVDAGALAGAGDRAHDVDAALRQLEAAGYFVRRPDAAGVAGTMRETSALPLLEARPIPGAGGARCEPTPGDEAVRAAADHILGRLNELRKASWTWAKYTPLSARHAKNTEHIRGRLREGYGEGDLVLVLEYLAAVDGGKDESRRYFDSVTPFNTKNFERNLAMARDWDARGRPPGGGLLPLQRSDGHDPAIYERRVKGGSA
jgi:hypothetical protein